ncbi:hypothetical protein ACNOYE_32065 [Nannocystaceae bacterium ST9]
MLEHSDPIDRAVAELRARRSPPVDAEARVLAALELEFAGPPGGGGGDGSASLAGGGAPITAIWVAKVIGAGTAMTAGGLALLRAGAIVVGMAADASEPSEPTQAMASEQLEAATREPIVREPIAVEPRPASEPASPKLGVEASARVSDEPEPDAAPISVDDLEAELALVRAARAQDDPERALEQLDEHARKFPQGSLADEREALRVVALCKLDRLAQARTAARSLVASRPRSPLLDRVREGCPALADELDD